MNPRQRQGLLALVVALGLAALTLSALQRYTADVARDVGERRDVLVLSRAVEAYDALGDGDVTVRRVPRRWASPYALQSPEQVLGRVAATGLGKGALLDENDLTRAPAAGPREREVSVVADVAASVAGAVRAEDRVDVIAVVAAGGDREPSAKVVATGLRILRVAPLDDGDVVPPDPDAPEDEQEAPGGRSRTDGAVTSVAVTVAVTSDQAADLVLADASAEALRLALLPRGSVDEPAAEGGAS